MAPLHLILILALAALTGACGRNDPPPLDPPDSPACSDGQWNDEEPCLIFELHPLDDDYHRLVVGDFDGDGTRELLGAYTSFLLDQYGELRTLARAPDGVWRGTPRLTHDGHFADLFIRDVDRDGRDDLLAVTGEIQWSGDTGSPVRVVRWLRSDADGFQSMASSLHSITQTPALAGDLDGDGQPELVVLTPVHLVDSQYYNRIHIIRDFPPDGFLSSHQTIESPFGFRAALADLDGDGRDDLVGATPEGRVWTWTSTPDATLEARLSAFPGLPNSGDLFTLLAGDLDSDGRADLLRLQYRHSGTTTIDLTRQTDDGAFVHTATIELSALPTTDTEGRVEALLLDLDGSGYPALALALLGEPTLLLLPQVGRLHGTEQRKIELDCFPTHLSAADLTGDGRRELLLVGYDEHNNNFLQIARLDP